MPSIFVFRCTETPILFCRAKIHMRFGSMKCFSVSCAVVTALILLSTGCGAPSSSVISTTNPQVALYQLILHQSATVTVEFGKDTENYGTSDLVAALRSGHCIDRRVAGMLAQTTYHMRGLHRLRSRLKKVYDSDHEFTTGSIPAGVIPGYSVETTGGLTPQSGVELVNTLPGNTPGIPFAMDLSGNVIWTYPFPDRQAGSELFPIKLLPNGHLMALIAPDAGVLTGPVSPSLLNVVREIDLVGNTIRQLTMADLNTRLAAAGFNITLQIFSHDFVELPNGHILVIANTFKSFTDLPGYPGTTNVLGDVVVDLDENFDPKWVWSEFDHLDVNRHPMNFPRLDAQQCYCLFRGRRQFLISIRHQNWIIKVDYRDGAGTGDILWKTRISGRFHSAGRSRSN